MRLPSLTTAARRSLILTAFSVIFCGATAAQGQHTITNLDPATNGMVTRTTQNLFMGINVSAKFTGCNGVTAKLIGWDGTGYNTLLASTNSFTLKAGTTDVYEAFIQYGSAVTKARIEVNTPTT